MLDAAAPHARRNVEAPKPQRHVPLTLTQWLARCATREEALRRAHTDSGLSMSALAKELGISVARVSQLIVWAEKDASTSVDAPAALLQAPKPQ